MLTYSVWLGIVSEFNYYTTAFEKVKQILYPQALP